MRKLFKAVLSLILLAGLSLPGCEKGNTLAPQSNITYLQKIRDGVVFFEGFENDNFVNADGWTVLQGVPGNSSSQYKAGIKSWDNSANAQSLPVAKKVITDTLVDTTWICQAWFYDDTSHTTEKGPYLKLKLADGKFLQVGVRNTNSTTNYVCNSLNVFTEDLFGQTTTIARTTGWHNFSFTTNGSSYFLELDGNIINVGTGITSSKVGEIHICSASISLGDTGNSFGYFDNVGYYRAYSTNIRGLASGGTIKMYNSTDGFIQSGNGDPAVLPMNALFTIFSKFIFPFSSFFEVSTSVSTNILNRTPLMQVNPGDIYQIVTVGPGQKFRTYNPQLNALSNVNKSTSGVQETIFNAYQNKYVFGLPMLEGFGFKEQFDNWYNYAVQGNPFSIQAEDNNIGFGVIDSNPAVGTKVVQIKPNLSTNPTDAFTVNRKYVLFNASNTIRQVVTVNAKNDPCLSFVENIEYPFANLDYIADITFHPFLELGQNPYGLSMMDERYIRFKFMQTVEEWNGG